MNKKKVELQVLNISNSQAQVGAYALVLGEVKPFISEIRMASSLK